MQSFIGKLDTTDYPTSIRHDGDDLLIKCLEESDPLRPRFVQSLTDFFQDEMTFIEACADS